MDAVTCWKCAAIDQSRVIAQEQARENPASAYGVKSFPVEKD